MAVVPGAYPDGIPDEVRKAMDNYYHHSNASSAHTDHEKDEEQFASLFTADGIYDFAGQKAKGTKAIIALRHKLFDNIPHRDHRVVKIFSNGTNVMELMALGEVDYVHHSGKTHAQPWAGHYVLTKEGNGLKFKSIAIILDGEQQEGHRGD